MEKSEHHFTNFKIHFNIYLRRCVKIDELAEYCKKNKIRAVGLCDSFNLCGA